MASADTKIAENAKVTVTFGDKSFSFELGGSELSEVVQADGTSHRYLGNASRDFIADELEGGLKAMFEGVELPSDPAWTE